MRNAMLLIISIGGGGAIGALLRYSISGLDYRLIGPVFPWGTIAVNMIGAFIMGVFWNISSQFVLPEYIRMFITVGILGAFTTFSTYALETVNLFRDGDVMLALCNVLFSNLIGIIALFSGIFICRFIIQLIR